MDGIYTEENSRYQIDLRKALSSTEGLHDKYKAISNTLNDVDWIAETDDGIILIEFTNYTEKPQPNNAGAKHEQIAKKYYGGMFYLMACDKTKPIDFVWIAESPFLDSAVRKRYYSSIISRLPFELQKNQEIKRELLRKFQVMSVSEWNKQYPQFPLTQTMS
ncbi:MAG: hypothetical protein FWD03_09510 [Defluviitaleaceae bacterium]|nr:hypothetical protein [Defluviitaleaceae bacterium]